MRVLLNHYCCLAVVCATVVCSTSAVAQSGAFLRVNQVGYLASDAKMAIAFSRTPLQGDFLLLDALQRVVYRAPLKSVPAPSWGGSFPYYYELNFSAFTQSGKNILLLEETRTASKEFTIG